MRQTHDRRATFFWSGDIVDQHTGAPADLSLYDINSDVCTKDGELIANLVVHKNDPQTGHIRISEDSAAWPLGDALWSLTLKKYGITVATEAVNLRIIDGGAHA